MRELTIHPDPAQTVISCCGELNAQTIDDFTALLEHSAAGRPTAVVVDCTQVAFMGVEGIKALFRCGAACRAAGVQFRVKASNPMWAILDRLGLNILEPA